MVSKTSEEVERALICKTPLGPVMLVENNSVLTHLILEQATIPSKISSEPSQLLNQAAAQLDEYFAGQRRVFELPLVLVGTDFQKKIWQGSCSIPYGSTITYGQIAEIIGHPRACRAAGQALRRNPLPIILPCHRVVGAGGELGGYYGGGPRLKNILLSLEARYLGQ